MNPRILELQDQINKAQNELEEIRKNCKHENGYYVGWWSWRVGALEAARICNDCVNKIDGATGEESKKLWADYYKPFEDWKKQNGITE